MEHAQNEERLASWFAAQLPGPRDVRIEGYDRVRSSHSAEMLMLSLGWHSDGAECRRDVVFRLRPEETS